MYDVTSAVGRRTVTDGDGEVVPTRGSDVAGSAARDLTSTWRCQAVAAAALKQGFLSRDTMAMLMSSSPFSL